MTRSQASLEVSGWRVTALSDGDFRLDGGAMWGVVPATLWRGMTPPDADNCIPLSLRPFLAERDGLRVLFEGGAGERWSDKERGWYHIERSELRDSLHAAGCAPEEVTHVIASHCHWDHIGALTVEQDGELLPLCPNAAHFAPQVEVDAATTPAGPRRGSYRASDVQGLIASGRLETYHEDGELLPGVRVHVLGGHSDGVSLVTLGEGEDEGEVACFWSDVVPTTHHIQPPYIMAYDQDVQRSYEVRSQWIARAADEGWIGMFYHDADVAFAGIERDARRYRRVLLEAGD